MVEVTIKVPDDLKEIISDTSETIYVEAIKEVASKRMGATQERLKQYIDKIASYEKKYGKSYKEFSENVPDTMKGHDDWVEWSYLTGVKENLATKMNKLKLLMGK